jgi:hypothetical protein
MVRTHSVALLAALKLRAEAKTEATKIVVPVGTCAICGPFRNEKTRTEAGRVAPTRGKKKPAAIARSGLLGWLSPNSVGYRAAQIEKRWMAP